MTADQLIRRLAAGMSYVLEHPTYRAAQIEAHAALNEARRYIAEQDAAAAPPADDYHSREAA